jgi:hypothetical protein
LKSFIIACILLGLVGTFVCLHTHHTAEILNEISALTQAIPTTETEFFTEYASVSSYISELCSLWDRYFSYIAFTIGYDNTNRCDEAICDLQAYCENRSAEDFAAALLRFRDALDRLRMLESFHPQSIF